MVGGDLLVCPLELRKEAWAGSRQEPGGHQPSLLPGVQGAQERKELALERASGSSIAWGESGSGENRKVEGTFTAENTRNFAVDGGVRKGLTEHLETTVWKAKDVLGVPASPQGLE